MSNLKTILIFFDFSTIYNVAYFTQHLYTTLPYITLTTQHKRLKRMTTYEEYQNDKKEFFSKITGEADVREDICYPYGANSNTYCKNQSWADTMSKTESYGVWSETIHHWDQKIYETMFVHDLGDGVIQETKKLVQIIHHTDIEYYCYGTHLNMGSKYLHQTYTTEVA